MADNKPRGLNLDDIDGEGVELAENDLLDQDVDFETIRGYEVVPRGEYRLRNEGVKLELSKTSQQPKFSIRASIQSGEFEGVTTFQDYSWAEKARGRSKTMFVGMGLPANFKGNLRQMAEALKDLEYYAVMDIEQSDGINERTQQPYDPRNRVASTSERAQTS